MSGPEHPADEDGQRPYGFLSVGADPRRIHREWQLTNTLWAIAQRLVALLILIACLPLFLVLYVPVRVSARAPFFFRQARPGFMGKPFEIVKITTMRAGSERVKHYQRGVRLDDPNVTRIGRFLRDTKIDEIPQLWNVFLGDMEFVGPRPIAFGLHDMLAARIPGFANRYLVKPGLTSIGQVSVLENAIGASTVEDWKQRFEGEEHYISHKSVSYDLILIGMTVFFVLRKGLRYLMLRLRPRRPAAAQNAPGES